jgi:hypothetical protein
MEIARPMDRIRDDARAFLERPAVLQHAPVDDRETDHIGQSLQLAEDQRAVGPGTGERYIKMITACLGLEAAFAGRTRRSVRCDPVAEG